MANVEIRCKVCGSIVAVGCEGVETAMSRHASGQHKRTKVVVRFETGGGEKIVVRSPSPSGSGFGSGFELQDTDGAF